MEIAGNDKSRYIFEMVASDDGIRSSIYNQSTSESITYEEFLIQLEINEEFRQLLTFHLLQNNYSSFFWECVPVSLNTLKSTLFQFMIIPSSFHDSPDLQSFSNQFQSASPDDLVISFKNLRGDADLVVPCPQYSSQNDLKHYTHLGSFLRDGHPNQIDELWKKTAQVMRHRLLKSTDDLVWLSTHGKGVYWLHIRLDSEPKYYQCQEFKHPQA